MKKLALTIAIVLGLGLTSFADPNGGGLFMRGASETETGANRDGNPLLPGHGLNDNQDANQTPLGSGVAIMLCLGAAYLVGKRRKEE